MKERASAGRLNVFAYFYTNLALGLMVAALGPTLPALAEQARTDLRHASLLFAVRSTGYLTGAFTIGKLFDRFRGNPLLGSMVFLMAGLMALVPLMRSLPALIAVLFVMGIAEVMFDIGCNTLLVWQRPEKAGPYLNGLHFCFGIGACIAPLLAGHSLAKTGTIGWAYWAMAMAMAPIVPLLLWNRSPARTKTVDEEKPIGQEARDLVFLIALFYFLYGGAEGSFSGWIFSYAVKLKMALPATAAYLTSAFWVTFTAGRLLGIFLTAKWRPRTILLVDLLGALASVAMLLVWPESKIILWAGTAGLGIFLASIFPTILAWATRRLITTSRVTRWFFVGAGVGGMFLPWLIGQLFEKVGPRVMLVCLALDLAAAMAVFALLMWRAPMPRKIVA